MDPRRAARRAAMPVTTALVEQYAEFGATVIYASENGHVYGKRPQYVEVFNIPAGYQPCKQFEGKRK